MGAANRPRVVLLGMLSRIPVGGVAWLVGQYAIGFERLGVETYYVESHSRTPSMFMENEADLDVPRAFRKAAQFVGGVLERFGLGDRWAIHNPDDDAQCYGLSRTEVRHLYREADLIINMHGGTLPLSEHAETGRLVYMGTDPVELELELHRGYKPALDFMAAHSAHFTWALNFGNPDCRLPWARDFPMTPSPPPVIMDFWDSDLTPSAAPFTTVGNWRQDWRNITFRGEVYRWSKHHEFLRIIDLPRRIDSDIELALGCYEERDRLLLEEHGWRVRPAGKLSGDISAYRDYILSSLGEFTVAKDQNVRLRTGWFSERSATYLAAGRPVVTQDTGFGEALPTGEGLFAFTGIEDAADHIQDIVGNYGRHQQAAREIAREHFAYDVVLADLLDHVGVAVPGRRAAHRRTVADLPPTLDLTPRTRRPLSLPTETVNEVLRWPVPSRPPMHGPPLASIVVPALNNLALTRMAVESVLANSGAVSYELIIVDNGSSDSTPDYLSVLAAKNGNVIVIRNEENRGFAAASNQGLSVASGAFVFLLNNDTIVPRNWLEGLLAHLQDRSVGLVGPVTNRCGNEAEVTSHYSTYGELLRFAEGRRATVAPTVVDIPVAVMFCVGLSRETLDAVGLLDERYGLGMFEDDDYAHRVRMTGRRVVCAEGVFVHHFGEGSLGWLAAAGRYGELFATNQRLFEEKWGMAWKPHGRRRNPTYEALRHRVSGLVSASTQSGSVVLVISRGDDLLLEIPGREGRHFPSAPNGGYAGHHSAHDCDAIYELESMRRRGARYLAVPTPGMWWLDHYQGFRHHLDRRYHRVVTDAETAVIYDLHGDGKG